MKQWLRGKSVNKSWISSWILRPLLFSEAKFFISEMSFGPKNDSFEGTLRAVSDLFLLRLSFRRSGFLESQFSFLRF